VPALVGQRVFAMALGYEGINDHDHLRHDPVLQVLAGKLTPKRSGCAALAGKLRTSDKDAADGAREEIARIVAQIRARWPEVEIILRADSGFCPRRFDDVVRGERLTAMAKDAGFDIHELFGRGRGPAKGGKVAAKYRDPKNPANTWTGRGRMPRWMAAATKGNKAKRDDFLI
jgi:hypothetical protein